MIKNTKNNSILFSRKKIIDKNLIKDFDKLNYSLTGTKRICIHESEKANFHVMLIESTKEVEFPAHLHSDGPELITIVSGILKINFFAKKTGKFTKIVTLQNGTDWCKAVLIPKNIIHSTRSETEKVIYLETKLGPFNKDSLKIFEFS